MRENLEGLLRHRPAGDHEDAGRRQLTASAGAGLVGGAPHRVNRHTGVELLRRAIEGFGRLDLDSEAILVGNLQQQVWGPTALTRGHQPGAGVPNPQSARNCQGADRVEVIARHLEHPLEL